MPKDGELPWENAHIDHTCLDINLVSSLISLATCNISSAISSEQISLGRCWATFLVDGYSKRILAVYLSFEPPSYRSCLMVIRICVKRFGRLPQTIITDNGKEFHSVYFKQLLAYYKCNHKYRPSGEPRYGSPVERVFGTTNTLWLHELQGNTQILKNNRQVTKSVNPIHQAVWTIGELYQSLETWAYSIYDNRHNSSLGLSPFKSVVQTFSQYLTLPQQPDLLSNWEFLYERSLGCVGILKDWLSVTLSDVLDSDGNARTITLSDLQRHALGVRQCLVMLKSISIGEQQLQESSEDLLKLQKNLKLIPSSHGTAHPKHSQSKKEQKNPKKPIAQTSPRRYPLKKEESEKEEKETDFFHSL